MLLFVDCACVLDTHHRQRVALAELEITILDAVEVEHSAEPVPLLRVTRFGRGLGDLGRGVSPVSVYKGQAMRVLQGGWLFGLVLTVMVLLDIGPCQDQ